MKFAGSHKLALIAEKRGRSSIRRPTLTACGIVLCGLLAACAQAQFSFSFLPATSVFPSLRADGLEHQLSLTKITENSEWMGAVGGSVPVLRFADSVTSFQLGAAASVFSSLLKTPGHISVLTIDYRVDFPIDVQCPLGTLRFGYGHVSSHFADDGVRLLVPLRRNVVKDYILTGIARTERPLGGTLYGIAQWNYHALPYSDRHWMFQLGMNSVDVPLSGCLSAYAAGDVKIREDVAWGTTRSIQIGISLAGASTRVMRFAYTWRSGFDERGQFFDTRTTFNLLSIGLAW